MTTTTTAVVMLMMLAVGATAATAGTFEGRWAANASSCAGEVDLEVSPRMLRWRETACVIRTSYLVRKAWHIGARCWAEGVSAEVPIKLQLRDDRLVFDWASAPQKELQRCR